MLGLRQQPLVGHWDNSRGIWQLIPPILATVELACHTASVSSGRNGPKPSFKDWILLGKMNSPPMGPSVNQGAVL